MSKNLLIWLVISFVTITSFAQEAHYELSIDGRVDFSGSTCGNNITGGLQWIAAEFQNGTHQTLVQGSDAYPNVGNGLRNSNFNETITFTESNKVVRLKLKTTRRTRGTFGCRSSSHTDSNPHPTISQCMSQSYTFSSLSLNQPGNMDVLVTPKITLPTPTNTNIGSDDLIVIQPINGILSSYFDWEYSFNGSTWVNFPTSLQNRNFINNTADEILSGGSTGNNHGKNLYIRVNTNCNNSFSNVIVYDYKLSAPHISIINETPVACFEDENGTIKVNFDRALITGELLSISMTNTTTGIDYSESNIRSLATDNSHTINNLPPGNYTVRVIGAAPGYNGNLFNTYSDGPTHSSSFTISEPSPVEFSYTKVDVWCNGGSDGEITITANGGIPETLTSAFYEYKMVDTNPTINGDMSEDWTSFSGNTSHTINSLPKDRYSIQVRDSNGCIAKVIQRDGGGQIVGLGAEIVEEIEITQPVGPLSVDILPDGFKKPTAFSFSDGFITAKINGGTKLSNGTYNFVWKFYNTVTSTWVNWADFNYSYDTATGDWYVILQNAKAGDYKLTVTDANYDEATNKMGCTIVEETFTLEEPPLLKLSLAETNAISCHNANTFGDPSSDGELTATATGGVPFDPLVNGLAYTYEWKKKDAAGIYQIIAGETSNVLSNINAGDYAVNIIDANGITVGTAVNNVISPVDVKKTIYQPDLLEIALTKVDVFCNGGNDGSIDATITGGTGNYTISWNTGANTEDINTLIAGTYTIDVTDEKGCQAQATLTIDEPIDPLEINYTFFAPTFTGATNGWIEATVTGGTPLASGAYTYMWEDNSGTNLNAQVTETINTSSYVIKLNNLGAGIYNLTIEDKNHPLAINPTNCTIIASEYELFEPEPLSASIELHTPISCNSTNTYGDPFSDGALEVIAEGGVQLQPTDNNGLTYYYTWKKETSPGVWTVLTTQTTNIAANLDAGNYAVNIEDANGIIIGVYVNNVLVNATDVTYLFEEPPLLELSIQKQDVYCFNGSDSWAKAIITGGTAPYSILWSNGDTTEQTSDLSQGTYTVSITDSRGCQVDGSIQINQPNTPLAIDYTAFATPSTGGVSDGWIEAQITGGTDFDDGSYTYYWQDEAGTILNAQTTTSIVSGIFQIRLNAIPKGTYYLTIEDANFPLATTGDGCTIIDDEFILYDPIEAVISVHTPISCHQENVFNNPFSDGKLQVSVTGGLPFATGQPYIYYWKKETVSGNFEDLNQNSDTAIGLSDGNYALNVEDSRGVVIGVYESLNLIDTTDVSFDFVEPDLLEVSLTATDISCGTGNDGTATVAITGGIPPYDIQWSDGQTTATAIGLIANNYVVYVTDARECQASGSINLTQPGGLNIEITEQQNPSCFQGNDGRISLEITGGVAPYTYAWVTGETTTSLTNLSEGIYMFELKDANGCMAFKEIVLENPDEITIDLGENRTLCEAQSHILDGSIDDPDATYSWTSDNGFTANTAQVTVTEAGKYQVIATSALGCIVMDSVTITTSDTAIDAEFLISSQAYVNEDIVLVNISNPLGETSQWDIPDTVAIIEQSQTTITLRFPKTGTYPIGIVNTQGNCFEQVYKNIIVEESSGLPSAGDTEQPFIQKFIINPNPNDGNFEIQITLAESSPVALRIFDNLGNLIHTLSNTITSEEYNIPVSLNLATGLYLVVLETAQETQIKRLIKN